MYKVFFNDRIVFLTDDFVKCFQENQGLFYKYRSKLDELKDLLSVFADLNKIAHLYICHSDTGQLINDFRSCFRYIEAAGGLVRNVQGETLFINRLDRWDLPKGKSDGEESAEETALREVEEECGLNGMQIISELPSTYHTYFAKEIPHLKKTRWFEMYYSGKKEPEPQWEEFITKAVWTDARDIPVILKNTYPSIIDLLKASGII